MSEKLSNVIGAPFQQYVLDQLYTRAAKNTTDPRSVEDVLFLANKSAWVRLISSVNIVVSDDQNPTLRTFYEKLGLGTEYSKPEDLAKNWILEAGTSKRSGQGINLRGGLGPDGAYGLGGIKELGYRPLPGLSTVQIETVGTLGSLRQATINFKVWNMNQLNVIEALYFRLGYSMLLEWGHTQFYKNTYNNGILSGITFTTATNTFGLDEPFGTGVNKTLIQQKIATKSKDLSGNYDAMYGIVSNFNWSFNQEGGYDCNVKLIGLGSVIDSLRINQSYKMPPGLVKSFEEAKQLLSEQEIARLEKEKKDALEKERQALEEKIKIQLQGLPAIPTDFNSLYEVAVTNGGFKGDINNFLQQSITYPAYNLDFNTPSTIPDYFYLATSTDKEILNLRILGLFLRNGGKRWVPLHASFGKDQGGSSFSVNTALLEAIAVNWTNSFNLQTQRDAVKRLGYGSTLTKGFDVLLGSSTGVVVIYSAKIINDDTSKDFSINIGYKYNDLGYRPTKQAILVAFDNWLTGDKSDTRNGNLYLTNLKLDRSFKISYIYQDVIVTGVTAKYIIKDVPYTGPSTYVKNTKPVSDVAVWFELSFDNTAIIDQVQELENIDEVPLPAPEAPNTGDDNAATNDSTDSQTQASETYESALHVMLSYIKTTSLTKATGDEPVKSIDIVDATKTFYQDGVFKQVFQKLKPVTSETEKYYNLTRYAKKGFNSRLMSDYKLYDSIRDISFEDLCIAYLIKYNLSNVQDNDNSYPVYIKMGYLLAFINNLCLIYDSRQLIGSGTTPAGEDKNPYVFIDFNPTTNLCLTNPQQMSVDPLVCLIPFEGTDNQYTNIFPSNVSGSVTQIFVPSQENVLNGRIDSFQTQNPYQGQIMNILLNVDYLLKTLSSFSTSNKENLVDLKGFLERILDDVSKCLGNLNMFRLSYLDESNTIQIKDEQYVPEISGESSVITRSKGALGELPVFGEQSLARQFQFKSNFSTKLGSMIAISAQAATGSVNSTDPSSLSWLNRNYQDRYKPYIADSSAKPTGGSTKSDVVQTKPTDQENNDLTVADFFNTHIKSIYSNFELDVTKIDTAKNYYIERMSKLKSDSTQTSAAPPLPADLELTIDGIAGIYMGNAFTIPESRLPLTLRGEIGKPKVGFVVAGLTHTINENQWLTKIRGQMIRLRDAESIESQTKIAKIQGKVVPYRQTGAASVTGGSGLPRLLSDQEFANRYTNGILPAIVQEDNTYKIARIEGQRIWLQPNPDYERLLVTVQVPTRLGSQDVKVHPSFAVPLKERLIR